MASVEVVVVVVVVEVDTVELVDVESVVSKNSVDNSVVEKVELEEESRRISWNSSQ